MSLTKYTASTAIIAGLADLPNATSGLTAAQLKAKFDENPAAFKTFVNSLIDEIEAAYETKENLTTARKLSATGDFTGTLNGAAITASDPGLASAFNAHTANTTTAHGINTKANKTQEAWISGTLAGGWTGTLRYAKNDVGLVTIDFDITSGTLAGFTNIATIPTGYVPVSNRPLAVNALRGGTDYGFGFVIAGGNLKVPLSGGGLTATTNYTGQITYYAG